jgi:hypothetical protein
VSCCFGFVRDCGLFGTGLYLYMLGSNFPGTEGLGYGLCTQFLECFFAAVIGWIQS